MTRLFTADVSTGDLQQFGSIGCDGPDSHAVAAPLLGYKGMWHKTEWKKDGSLDNGRVRVARTDADCGHAVRFEQLATDVVPDGATTPPYAIAAGAAKMQTSMYAHKIYDGDTFWVAWSAKFDEWSWPTNRVIQNFCVTDAIHGFNSDISQIGAAGGGYTLAATSVYWGMHPFSGAYPYTGGDPTLPNHWVLAVDRHPDGLLNWYNRQILLQVPITLGRWYDIRMRIYHDAPGSIKVWINGELQTLVTGGTEYTGDVSPPKQYQLPTGYWGWQHCIYRGQRLPQSNPNPVYGNAVMQRANFRIASTEGGL